MQVLKFLGSRCVVKSCFVDLSWWELSLLFKWKPNWGCVEMQPRSLITEGRGRFKENSPEREGILHLALGKPRKYLDITCMTVYGSGACSFWSHCGWATRQSTLEGELSRGWSRGLEELQLLKSNIPIPDSQCFEKKIQPLENKQPLINSGVNLVLARHTMASLAGGGEGSGWVCLDHIPPFNGPSASWRLYKGPHSRPSQQGVK